MGRIENPFPVCPVCNTSGSIMTKENQFECSVCGSTLSYEAYKLAEIEGE